MPSKLFVHLLIVAFIFSMLPSFAQRGGGSGKQDLSGSVIFEDVLNRPTDASTITLIHASGEIRQTGLDGSDSFTFKKCPNGSYTLQINAEGYEAKELLFTVSPEDYSLSWIPKLFGIPLKKKGSRMRTRTIDYSNWDKLQQTWILGENKTESAKALIAEANKNFTPEDEEYYMAYKNAGFLYAMYGDADYNEAIKCYEIAFQAKAEHYPFQTRFSFPLVPPQSIIGDLLWLTQAYTKFGLYSTAIQVMKSNEDLIKDLPLQNQVQYYSQMGWLYCLNQQYDEAITCMKPMKEIMESGQSLSTVKSNAEEIYKIDKDDPKWLQKSQQKNKEEYEKNMQAIKNRDEDLQQTILAMQYYSVLGEAYYSQYKWAEAVPYLKAYIISVKDSQDKLKKMMPPMPENGSDSLGKIVHESKVITDDLNDSWKLVIANFKSGKADSAREYAYGLLSQAVYHQLEGRYEESRAAISEIENKSPTDFVKIKLAPFKLNLSAVSQDFTSADQTIEELLRTKETSLQKNFNYFSESQRREFMREYGKLIDQYNSLSLSESKQNPEKALKVLNKSLQTKGLILDITRAQQSKLNRVTDEQVLRDIDKIKALNRKVAALSAQNQQQASTALADSIKAITLRIDDLQRKVNQQLGSDTILQQISWQDIQKRLQPGEAYVEIVKVNRDNFLYDAPEVQYWAFVIHANAGIPQALYLEKEQNMEQVFSTYRRTLSSKRADSLSYQMFWSKIQSACAEAKRIYLCSDGIYQRINPHTLKASSGDAYVLETTDVVKISTGRDLLKPGSPIDNKSIALIGNPAFNMNRKSGENQIGTKAEAVPSELRSAITRSNYSDLPGTLEEVKRIAEQARTMGYAVEVLEGTQATEANVKKLAQPGILHMATHGEFDKQLAADSYLKSKLVLAGAADTVAFTLNDHERYEDGLLSAYEVTQLDLSKTYMVVLSACETGLGDVQAGEGVWGLQRAFQLAGANYVLTSLWQISDEATVTFMDVFYKSYFSGKDIQTAYKTAMMETKTVFPEPYYWGAFVLNVK